MGDYTVYKHTSPSGKVYIGITRQEPTKRWDNGKGYKHSPHFRAAIEKYGWENIAHEILATGLTKKEAEELEVALIAQHRSTDRRFGYNADKGGSTGPKHTEATRARIGEANRRRVWTPESRAKMRAQKLAHPTSPETAKKIGKANLGRKHRQESIEKIRAAQPKRPVVDIDTGTEYPSIMAAARARGIDPSHLAAACRGRRKSAGGCRWAYKEVVA